MCSFGAFCSFVRIRSEMAKWDGDLMKWTKDNARDHIDKCLRNIEIERRWIIIVASDDDVAADVLLLLFLML